MGDMFIKMGGVYWEVYLQGLTNTFYNRWEVYNGRFIKMGAYCLE